MIKSKKYILGLLLALSSALPILAQNSGDGYNPDNPSEPGGVNTMLSYNVAVALGTEGAGTVSGGGRYKYGTTATINATAVSGYKFAYWLKNDETEPYKTSQSFSYTVSEDVRFTAVYERVKLVGVKINDEAAGKVSSAVRHNVISSEEKEVVIGNPNSTTYTIPFGNYYRYSTSESIYTPAEVGSGGQITSLAFQVSSASSLSSTVKIYMGHKSSSTFSSTSDYVPFSSLTLVYSSSKTIGSATGWETYTLDTPFEYNGEDNLVVVVTKSASSYTSSLRYRTISSSSQCLYRQNNSYTYYADASVTGSFSSLSSKPYIKFDMNSYVFGDKMEAVLNTSANKDYFFQYWLRNDETEAYSTEPSFVYPLGDDEWEVNFTAVYKYVYNPDSPIEPSDIEKNTKHNVTVSLSDERAGAVSGTGRYKYGTQVTISTSGKVGYEFKGWLKDGQRHSTNKSFTYTVGTDDVVFIAEYVNTAEQLEMYGHALNLETNQQGSCTFSLESGTRFMPDDIFTVEAIPGADQVFEGWYQDGVLVANTLTYSSYMGDSDINLSAHFRYVPDSPDEPNNPGGYVEEVEKEGLLGDVNGDGKVNVTDVISIINYYLSHDVNEPIDKVFDINKDGKVNVTDVISTINIYLQN